MSLPQQTTEKSQTEERSLVKVLNSISRIITDNTELAEYEKWKKGMFESMMWRAPELSWKSWGDAAAYLQAFCKGKEYEAEARNIFNGSTE